jgi:hypothetical protein
MGCGQSTDRQGEAVSRNIEEQLKKDREVYKNELKLLILGNSSHIYYMLSS